MGGKRRSQLTIEFIFILALSASYIAAGASLLGWGLYGIERFSLARERQEIYGFVTGSEKLLSEARGRLEGNFTVFPGGRLNAFSDGTTLILSTCGRLSGFETKEIPIKSKPFGKKISSCDDFPFEGKFGLVAKGNGKGEMEIEITDFN